MIAVNILAVVVAVAMLAVMLRGLLHPERF